MLFRVTHAPTIGSENLMFTSVLAAAVMAQNSSVFTVKKLGSTYWFSQRSFPKFWSLATDCTDLGDTGKPENPAYDGKALFGGPAAWARDTNAKLKSWGFNSLGAWSDHKVFRQHVPAKQRLPYFVVLHLGAYNKAPFEDMFTQAGEKVMDDAAKAQILTERNDPFLVGYFSDNELGWWDDTLFLSYMKMPRSAPGKQRVVQSLKDFYKGSFGALQAEWTVKAADWDSLLDATEIFLKPGTQGIKASNHWSYVLARHYYQLMHKLIRKYDSKHLILGDRYPQYYNLEVPKAAKSDVDVISTNLGAHWLDGTYSHWYLDTLHRITGKPLLITEFYFAAMQNQTGNRNSGKIFPTVETQTERARGFGRCIQELAKLPYVLGAHWFQFYDEPPKGRGDGEDYNMGLVDIHGKPYPQMIAASRASNPSQVHASPPRVKSGVPRAPKNPLDGKLLTWDRERGYIPASTLDQWGDMYACYDSQNLYIATYTLEFTDEHLYADAKVPEADRPLLRLHVGGKKFALRYGGSKNTATFTEGMCELREIPEWKHCLIFKVPAKDLGKKTLSPGDTLHLSGELFAHARGYRMAWNQTLTLR